jgi:uncharacterized membrane protein
MGTRLFEVSPLIALVAVSFIHAVFAYKEIVDWERSAVKVLGMTIEDARAAAGVGRNQGLSNAFLSAGAACAIAVWSMEGPSEGRLPATFFALCALIAGIYGWKTFQKPGFLVKQALPGVISLAATWMPFWLGFKTQ